MDTKDAPPSITVEPINKKSQRDFPKKLISNLKPKTNYL
jgi:hypothetical protein